MMGKDIKNHKPLELQLQRKPWIYQRASFQIKLVCLNCDRQQHPVYLL